MLDRRAAGHAFDGGRARAGDGGRLLSCARKCGGTSVVAEEVWQQGSAEQSGRASISVYRSKTTNSRGLQTNFVRGWETTFRCPPSPPPFLSPPLPLSPPSLSSPGNPSCRASNSFRSSISSRHKRTYRRHKRTTQRDTLFFMGNSPSKAPCSVCRRVGHDGSRCPSAHLRCGLCSTHGHTTAEHQCQACRGHGHQQRNCPTIQRCNLCGRTGHLAAGHNCDGELLVCVGPDAVRVNPEGMMAPMVYVGPDAVRVRRAVIHGTRLTGE